MCDSGDNYFVIIQQYDHNDPPFTLDSNGKKIVQPILMLKYPSNIDWQEININDGICYQIFKRPIRNYFVFGDSGNWGKYVANDEEYPLEIFGFKREYLKLFRDKFIIPNDDINDLKDWLPLKYKKFMPK